MEEMNIKQMYNEKKTEEEKIKFLSGVFKEIVEISEEEIKGGEKLVSSNELEIKSSEIKDHLRLALMEMQRNIRLINSKKQIAMYKDKISELEKAVEEIKARASENIKRKEEEKEKIGKVTHNNYKKELKDVRASLIGTTETAKDLGEKIKEGANQSITLESVNNILLKCQKSAMRMKRLELWPEEEQFPEITTYIVEEEQQLHIETVESMKEEKLEISVLEEIAEEPSKEKEETKEVVEEIVQETVTLPEEKDEKVNQEIDKEVQEEEHQETKEEVNQGTSKSVEDVAKDKKKDAKATPKESNKGKGKKTSKKA